MTIDKSKLVDTLGRPLTQSLFLEINYNEYAVYTLKDWDYEYGGKIYPSLKALYLKEEDPIEYQFASKYLLGWNHWKRLCENKVLARYIAEWRDELELKLRSQGVKEMMSLVAQEGGSFQAAKFLADKGWDKRIAGRPSKAELEKHIKIQERVDNEYADDLKRLENVVPFNKEG